MNRIYKNMPKKCIPGVICIENMTLVVLIIALIIIGYLYYNYLKTISKINKNMDSNMEKIIIMVMYAIALISFAYIELCILIGLGFL